MTDRQISKYDFPLNIPVYIEAIIDSSCGWEFDAPLHIMKPFHLYREVHSVGHCAIEQVMEDLLIDLSCDIMCHEDDSWWPYSGESYVKGLFERMRKGKGRRSVRYFKSEVVVWDWECKAGSWTINPINT